MRTPVAPGGVLSLQFAFRMNRAQDVLDSWNDVNETAQNQILIDFGFLIVYPVAISLACLAIFQTHAGAVRHAALVLAWIALAAGPFDLLEDLASLQMLSQGATSLSAAVVSGAAVIKFLAALPPLLFLIVVALVDRK